MHTSTQKRADLSLSLALVIALVFIFIFILPLVACPLWGQVVQKKQLTAKDYHTFADLQFDKATPNGQWASYLVTYKNGSDTLFVRNTSTKKTYSYPLGSQSNFLSNDLFACMTPKGLELLNLNKGSVQTIESVKEYGISGPTGQILVISGADPSDNSFMLLDQNGKTTQKIQNVVSFKMSPCSKKALLIRKDNASNSIGILDMGKKNSMRWIMEKNPGDFKMLTWEKTARALVFINEMADNTSTLFYYTTQNGILHQLDSKKLQGPAQGQSIFKIAQYPITISDDLQRIFFGVEETSTDPTLASENNSSEVECWNANAKWIYPRQKIMSQVQGKTYLGVWFANSQKFMPISSASLPQVMLNGDQSYAILSNSQAYEPQYDFDSPRDFYTMKLSTGKKELILQKQSVTGMGPMPIPSPGGKYISYFRNHNWWVYDLRLKTHVTITQNIGVPLTGKAHSLYRDVAYGIAGWTPNDKEIILYDQFDIWMINPQSQKCRRITRGREKQIQLRIIKPGGNSGAASGHQANYEGSISKTIDIQAGLILEAKGTEGKTGYFKWDIKKGEMPIVFEKADISLLSATHDQKSFIYQKQQFDLPPQLLLAKGTTSSMFFQSNPQKARYKWGTSKLISYSGPKGDTLQGVLYYPADYDPGKKYPMVVHVYEQQSHNLNKFINPSLENEDAYNPTVLTSEGYFVLCPDIVHEPMNEGPSSAECTVAATREVISRGLVYPDKIALMGHSFGGYETSYIITRTGIFAAAVAGSAITDLTSYYLSVNWENGRATMNYFTNDHFKMVKSPHEIPGVFSRNSPLAGADKITTPLLSFTGKEDYHVNWQQSVEFYMALRRLGKKHIMLLYPKEAHTILDPVNQRDLTTRVLQWFGYYLKNEVPAPWISEGTR